MQFMKPFARLHRSDSDDHQALWLAILVDVDRHCLGKIERATGDGMRHLPDHPVISLDSGNPSTPPIRMRSPLRMVANGVSDTIATLSVWLSLPLQANLTKNNLNLKVIKYNLLLSYSWNAATTRA
jgi:hypothetical protein